MSLLPSSTDQHRMDHSTPASAYSSADAMHLDEASPTDEHGIESLNHDLGGSVEGSGDGRRGFGRRELSTSKRAAQNRAAQRAFRQRKEGYIKKLEEQVRDYENLNQQYNSVKSENHQLRDYILVLRSRLLETQGEVPPQPAALEGLQPGTPRQQQLKPPPSISQSLQQSSHATLPRIQELGSVPSPRLSGPPRPDMMPVSTTVQSSSVSRSPLRSARIPPDANFRDHRYPGP